MNAKTNCAYCALLLTLIGAPFQAGAIGPELQGTVKNLGDANQNNNGVAGVSISIKDKNGKEIGSGLTDAKGNYKIGLLKQPSHLTAYFDKLGFQSRSTFPAPAANTKRWPNSVPSRRRTRCSVPSSAWVTPIASRRR